MSAKPPGQTPTVPPASLTPASDGTPAATPPPPYQCPRPQTTTSLIIQFHGFVVIRLPTDPDPPDEPRGVSGYTFAFAGEPDLDRIIYLQPPPNFTPRSHTPPLGVTVYAANKVTGSSSTPVPALMGARVNLEGAPRLENRNWTLTLPGFEPIWPFDLSITASSVGLRRSAPFDANNPNQPLWQITEQQLLSHGAQGMEFEPETVGKATGIWDSLGVAVQRLADLQQELAGEQDPVKKVALQGRISELTYAVANPTDRRTGARYFVERFSFPMCSKDAVISGDPTVLNGTLDCDAAWQVSFWMGGWDPDLLCAFMEGNLQAWYCPPTAD